MSEIVDQPAPVPNDRPAIADLAIADMVERKRIGIERYGMPLQASNGRDALVDAYQEALDLCMYLRQAIEERSARWPHHTQECTVSHSLDIACWEAVLIAHQSNEQLWAATDTQAVNPEQVR